MNEVLEVPEGWKIEPLSNCSTITNSNVDKKYIDDELEIKLCNYMDVYVNEEIDKSVNFMTATATILEIEKFELKQNDVIITKDSESPDDIAIPTYIKKDLPNVLCGYHLTLLRPKMECNGKFLAIALQSSRYKKYFGALASGSTRFALSLGVISNTPILLPPLKEQQKIAKILSTLDSAIEASQKLIAKEKNIKKGLMHDLLTNGIDENGTIRSPKTNKYKESELGLISVGWESGSFNELDMQLIDGDRGNNYPKSEDFLDYGYCLFLNAKNVTKQGFKFDNVQFISKDKDKKLRKGKLYFEDFILTTRGTVGNIAYYKRNIQYKNVRINSGMIILRYQGSLMTHRYLYTFFYSGIFEKQIVNTVFGSAQPQLTVKEIEKFVISFPKSKSEQQKIANIITTQDKKIETEEKNLEKLKELKKGLMHDLLSGKVRVKV